MFPERWVYIVRLRLRSFFRRSRVEDDLADELGFHLEERARSLVERGMSAEAARVAALREFGGLEQRKEECRDARRIRLVEDFGKDLAYAARMMRRAPGFTAVAVFSLALGIGTNTAIFSVFDTLVVRPLPVQHPEELRTTRAVIRLNGRGVKSNNTLPFEFFRDLQADRSSFSEILAFSHFVEPVVTEHSRLLQATGGGLAVSPNYFTMLGVGPRLGRFFIPSEGSAADRAVILSDGFWHREFGADPGVLGRTLNIDGSAYSVIGVAPRGFFGLAVGRRPDFYITFAASGGTAFGVQVVGRLAEGVTDAEASARITSALAHSVQRPKNNAPSPVVEILPVDTGLSEVREQFAEPLSILMAMVSLLLLAASANVATLLLSRASARRTEIVIRSSIGAGRARLLRQLTTESLLLVGFATVAGVLLASWGMRALIGLMQYVDTPLAVDLGLDLRVLVFTAAAAAVAALVTGVAPALHTSRHDAAGVLKTRQHTGAAGSSGRLGPTFVVAQVALSLTLVAGAGLLARTLHELNTIDAGFEPEGVALVAVNPGARGYQGVELSAYFTTLADRLRTAPGVERASLVQFGLLTDARTTGPIDVPGFTPASEDDRLVQIFQVGADFFATLRIPIVEGRDFLESDMTATPRPIAINEAARRRYFPNGDAVGRTINNGARVMAVVKDGRYNSLRDEMTPVVFVPYTSAGRTRMTYAVRLAGVQPAGTALQTLLAEARAVDPLVPVQGDTLDAAVGRSLGQERLLATMATFFGMAALLLMALGLYGVMAFWVTARTPEIGVRVALGARRPQVAWEVIRHPLTLVAIGVVAGVAATIAGGRLAAHVLFRLAPQDPLTIGGSIAFLSAVAAVAAALPARRACRIDPVAALRNE